VEGSKPRAMNEQVVQDRTKEAFRLLTLPELAGLYSLARRLDEVSAEDLVQETLLRAYRSFGTLKTDASVGPWLKRILVNVFHDTLRKRSRAVEEVSVEEIDDFSLYRTIAIEDPFPYSDTLHHDFLSAFGKEDVHAVLMRIQDIYRAPLVLHYMEGWSTKEIAQMLDVPLGTVLARLHRARKRFEIEMWSYAGDAGLLAREETP